jgi:hypothetical protein
MRAKCIEKKPQPYYKEVKNGLTAWPDIEMAPSFGRGITSAAGAYCNGRQLTNYLPACDLAGMEEDYCQTDEPYEGDYS